jgi:hypothetical protein
LSNVAVNEVIFVEVEPDCEDVTVDLQFGGDTNLQYLFSKSSKFPKSMYGELDSVEA